MYVLRWAARFWIGALAATVLLVGLLLALRLLLPLFSSSPALVQTTPANRSAGVLPRSRVTLRFSTPMNRRSVAGALQIDPSIAAELIWSDQDTTLTISPTQSLRPDTSYRIALGAGALSHLFRAPDEPLALSFRTAPAPAVLVALPPDGAADVALDTPISIRFSRTIVPTTTLVLPTSLPELGFDPPVAGSATWLDPATVLFQPSAPLRPGARYRATLDAGLTDLGGGELGQAYSWSFSTPPPKILAIAPPIDGRWGAPRAPLTLRLSQALDPSGIKSGFVVTPTIAGNLDTMTLPDATQLITFTPTADWQPGGSYTAALRLGVAPQAARWSFTAAPRPVVIGRFPGEGQMLPVGQDIRLIFNTPVDSAALRDAVRLDPPAGVLRVSAESVEARISADLRAATAYTLTLPAALTDRNGVPFARKYQIRFVTASAGSALELPDAPAHLFQAAPGAVDLPIRRTNLSALNLDLYVLDEATTVRALAFGEADWVSFQPERYAQQRLRSWSVPLSDTLNTPADDRLRLGLAAGQPLPLGVYYLRMQTPEGPRADLLLLISRVRLAMQLSAGGIIVWATDVISTTPVGALPLVLYQDGALIERGTTDASGLWRGAAPRGAAPRYIALAAGARPALASSIWNDGGALGAGDRFRAWLTTDRAIYRPGDTLALAGFVRRAASRPSAPPPGLQVLLTARQLGAPDLVYRQTIALTGTGVISAGFTLPADAAPGEYILGATIAGAVFHTTFVVRADEAPPLDVAIDAPSLVYAGDAAPLNLTVRAPEGAVVAGAEISWTLSVERQPFPAYPGYTFGDDEQAPVRPEARSGIGRTDAGGRFDMVISDTVAGDTPLRYRLAARVTEPGGLSVAAEGRFMVAPAQVYAGVLLPSRVLLAGQIGAVEALAVAPDGQPVVQARIAAVIYRRVWKRAELADQSGAVQQILRPSDERVATLSGETGADGTVRLPLTLRAGGEYRVRVSVDDAAGRRMSSATTLWVAAPGFADWRADSAGGARLIADRPAYRPGDTATLLIAAPHGDTSALITVARAAEVAAEVRQVRAGVPLTLTLAPEDAPEVRVALLLASPAPSASISATAPITLATATLPVLSDDRAISVTVAADRAAYRPGATATLTITTTDARGAGVPADLILDVAGARAAPRHDTATGSGLGLVDTFRAGAPPALIAARIPGALPTPPPAPLAPPLPPVASAPSPLPAPLVYWNPALRTSAAGVLTVTFLLPAEPADLRVLAWAARADQFGQASASLAVTRPLELEVSAPAFFRVGDKLELAALVRNTSAVTQEASLTLDPAGLAVRGTPLTRRVALAPGASVRVVWPALIDGESRASLSFDLAPAGGEPLSRRIERPILPASKPTPHAGGVGILREYVDPLNQQPLDSGKLGVGQLVRVRLTIVNSAARGAVAIDEPLPGGFVLIAAPATEFAEIRRDTGLLTLVASDLPPGIYQYQYVLRAVAAGSYSAPATTVRLVGGDVIGTGDAGLLIIVARS